MRFPADLKMKKGLIATVLVAVLAVGGAGGYMVYQQKQEEKAYEVKMSKALSQLPPITVFEHEDLPTVEEEFAGTEDIINIDSIQPDISNVYTTEPGKYEVKYKFTDSNGEARSTSVVCIVKPDLANHVTGMKDIEIDKGDEIPTSTDFCTFDEYVDSITMNTDMVDNEEAGTYDISYTILGVDGEMKTIEGYKCTVNEVAPPPTPTPTPKKEKPKKEEKKKPAEEQQNEESQSQTGEETAVGNVEVQQNVVETGDENNLIAIGAILVVCLGAVSGVLVYKKKKKDK